jgi:hypothetical protein
MSISEGMNQVLARRCYTTILEALVKSGMERGAAEALIRDYVEQFVRYGQAHPPHAARLSRATALLKEARYSLSFFYGGPTVAGDRIDAFLKENGHE